MSALFEIGGVLDPLNWERWEEAKALLEPSQRRFATPDLIKPDEHALWVVLEGDELIGVATARITDIGCEVILIGGRNHRRWLGELDRVIGAAAKQAGAARMFGSGRRGWLRELKRLGWVVHSEKDGITVYSREL